MELHAILTPGSALQRQYWRGLSASMQLHEMRYIKRAGVAGIALRAGIIINYFIFLACACCCATQFRENTGVRWFCLRREQTSKAFRQGEE
ncbi:hypothetical protein CUU45_00970 [Pectobacterium polaris]|nr:hypothetical protein [Pectobacterium polaris]